MYFFNFSLVFFICIYVFLFVFLSFLWIIVFLGFTVFFNFLNQPNHVETNLLQPAPPLSLAEHVCQNLFQTKSIVEFISVSHWKWHSWWSNNGMMECHESPYFLTRYHVDSLSWISRTRELGLWFHVFFSDWWFGTMEFMTFHIPTDELHHFSEG